MTAGVRDDVAMSIPVSCDGVKMHVFMDDSISRAPKMRKFLCLLRTIPRSSDRWMLT
jgi:hypothetical protein